VERAGSALGPLIKDLGLEDALKLYRIQHSWKKFVGEPLASHSFPAALKGGLLFVNVNSPAWLQQAGYFKTKMIEKLGGFGVSDMRLKLGRLEPPARKERTSVLPPRVEPDPAIVEELISAIEDDELREAARRAVRKALGTPRKKD